MGKIVDISKWQGTIDFPRFAQECDLAIVRVQYGSSTEDIKHKEYEAGLKTYGVPFGSYAYARFVSVNDAKVEAQDFLKRADAMSKFYVVDVEELTCPADQVVAATQAFIDVLRQAGAGRKTRRGRTPAGQESDASHRADTRHPGGTGF